MHGQDLVCEQERNDRATMEILFVAFMIMFGGLGEFFARVRTLVVQMLNTFRQRQISIHSDRSPEPPPPPNPGIDR